MGAQRQEDGNGVGQRGAGACGWGRAEGRDVSASAFILVFCFYLLCISLAQIFSWHLWLILSISVSLCVSFRLLSFPVPSLLVSCYQPLWRQWIRDLGTHHQTGHPRLSRAHFHGTHQLCPRTLPSGLLSAKDHSPLFLKPSRLFLSIV